MREIVVPVSAKSFNRPRTVLLTALRVEYLAMRPHCKILETVELESGTRYDVGVLRGTGQEIALVCVGRGNVRAGVITERIVSQFRPDLLTCVGVAGALHKDLQLGDVVVATRVDAYHGGTASKDFLARPQTWPMPYRLEELARAVELSWSGAIGPTDAAGTEANANPDTSGQAGFRVHFRPIAAGEVVLDGRESTLFEHLVLHHNDAGAIDMEDAGIVHAAHLSDLPTLVVRGISDRADGRKTDADGAGWQQRAAANAAAFAAAVLTAHGPVRRAVGTGGDITLTSPTAPAAGALHGRISPRRPQAAYIRDKTIGFVGRDSAFAEIEAFLDQHPSGHLIVQGEPGVGKTALLAEAVVRNDWPAHFNIAGGGVTTTGAFLQSLYEQLSERYGADLPAPGPDADRDGVYVNRLIEEVAGRLTPGARLVIVVDALDELDRTESGANPLFLPTALPGGVYLLVSRRLRTAALQPDGAWTIVDLMNRPDESRADVAAFIRNSLAKPEMKVEFSSAADEEQFIDRLLERSDLNFMYLVYVLGDIERGLMQPDDVDTLPVGLTGYYDRHLRQMLSRDGGAAASLRTIYSLSALREPVSASLLAVAVRITELEVVRYLADWTQFLRHGTADGRSTYSFYHQTFSDYLNRHETVRAARVDLGEISSLVGHRLIAGLGLDLDVDLDA
ncbi:nucleoside phosphorylase [Catenulispora sp. MAP12-49]|uniref:phosphorylase family protein n=1 Tax=Catenulispora sp. MAP12-49 TaxID=3156302 RepID=UPI0035162768